MTERNGDPLHDDEAANPSGADGSNVGCEDDHLVPYDRDMTPVTPTPLGRDLRTWRDDVVAQRIRSLLRLSGCGFSIDDIARGIGVAKGSLYVDRSVVVEVIEQTLDSWAERVVPVNSSDSEDPFSVACWSLLTTHVDADGAVRPAIPCCLAKSPCPHRWSERWESIAVAFGLGVNQIAMLLGDALQAVAASDQGRALLVDGRTSEAVDLVLSYFEDE